MTTNRIVLCVLFLSIASPAVSRTPAPKKNSNQQIMLLPDSNIRIAAWATNAMYSNNELFLPPEVWFRIFENFGLHELVCLLSNVCVDSRQTIISILPHVSLNIGRQNLRRELLDFENSPVLTLLATLHSIDLNRVELERFLAFLRENRDRLSNLRHLTFFDSRISLFRETIPLTLIDVPTLEHLEVDNFQINNYEDLISFLGVALTGHFRQLRILNVRNSWLGHSPNEVAPFIEALSYLPHLEELSLQNVVINVPVDFLMGSLRVLPSLRNLEIDLPPRAAPIEWADNLASLPGLRSLTIRRIPSSILLSVSDFLSEIDTIKRVKTIFTEDGYGAITIIFPEFQFPPSSF